MILARQPDSFRQCASHRLCCVGGRCEGLPEIVSRGFISSDDGSEVLQGARAVVLKTLEGSSAEERTDWGVMQEKIRADLKRFLNKQTQRRPLIMPVILEV